MLPFLACTEQQTDLSPLARRFLNIGLHGTTLGTRFLFLFVLAKYLDPSSVGYYGLFTATVGYSLYFVGLDFYTYVTREMVKTPNTERGKLLKNQVALSGLLYVAFLPVSVIVLEQLDWPTHLMLWFVPILMLEHFNQELFRLLVALSEQITASLILFLRQGSWALMAVAMMAWDADTRELPYVMALWTCSGIAAALVGMLKLKSLGMGGWSTPVDWSWIRKGVRISIAFLVATLAIRGINTLDRYWMDAIGGLEAVAAYVLLYGVASSLMTFLDAGMFSFTYPALIRLHHQKDTALARSKVRQMLVLSTLAAAAFAVISWNVLPHLLQWINKSTYFDYLHLYPWILSAVIIWVISMVPHYGLYAQGQDKPIIQSHMVALPVFLAGTWVASSHFAPLAVPIGLNLAFTSILCWKSIAYWQCSKSEN